MKTVDYTSRRADGRKGRIRGGSGWVASGVQYRWSERVAECVLLRDGRLQLKCDGTR